MERHFSSQLRDAVEASGMSRYRISVETGIAESVLSRFMSGAGLSLENVDRLCACVGVCRIQSKRPPKKGS